MAVPPIFSADSHVSEPGDLWVTRIDKEFRFRAPLIERRERNGKMEDVFVYEGWPPHPVGVGIGAAAKEGESFRELGKGYEDALPGGWDPAARLKDQDADGVVGEVLYTTLGFRLFWVADAALQRACFRVYNDWLAELCSYAPERLVGLSLISLYDIPEAIKELERTAKQGHRGAMIFLSPPAPMPQYISQQYDPFWAAAQDLDMALVLHENTGGAESRYSQSSYWDPMSGLATVLRPQEVQRSLAALILSGVFERFPKLRVVSAENGTDWLTWWARRLNRPPKGQRFPTKLSMTPLEYLHRNVHFTYIDEPEAVAQLDVIGEDNLMFATDYPHSASTYPHSKEVVDRDTGSLPDSVARKLVYENTLRVFGIRVPALV